MVGDGGQESTPSLALCSSPCLLHQKAPQPSSIIIFSAAHSDEGKKYPFSSQNHLTSGVIFSSTPVSIYLL